jgi:hypothetical protein
MTERVFQQAAALEVGEQGGGGAVDVGGERAGRLVVPRVRVPRLAVAVVDLHEADAALDEAAGEEAGVGEVRRAVFLADAGRLAGEVERLAARELHVEGGLHRANPRFQGRFAGAVLQVPGVDLFEQVELPPLLGRGEVAVFDVRQHLGEVEVAVVDVRPLMLAGEKAARPELGEADRAAGAEDNVAGEVFRLAPQAVEEPRAEAGAGRRDGAVVHQEQGGAVVGVVGVHRANDAQVVDVPGRERQQLADRQPRLAAGLELVRHRHAAAGGVFGAEIDFLRPLPRELVESRLGIEKVPWNGPPFMKSWMMRLARGGKWGWDLGAVADGDMVASLASTPCADRS